MRKVIVIGRRAPGRSRVAAQTHMRTVHAALVLFAPPDAGSMPADYAQNHVFDGVYPSTGPYAIERDLITEIWPHAVAGPRAITPYFRETLQPDEENFVDNATVEKVFSDAQPLKPGPQGAFKAFLALSGASNPEAAADVVPEALSSTMHRGVPGPTGAAPFVDHIVEFWFAARAQAAAVLDCRPAVLARTGADPAASFAVAAEQFDSLRLKAALATGPTREQPRQGRQPEVT